MSPSNDDPTSIDLYDATGATAPSHADTRSTGAVPFYVPQAQQPTHRGQRTSTLAVLSAICSLSTPLTGFGFLAGILLGHLAVRSIDRTGDKGRGYATTGLISGYIWLVLFVLCVVALSVVAYSAGVAVNDLLGAHL